MQLRVLRPVSRRDAAVAGVAIARARVGVAHCCPPPPHVRRVPAAGAAQGGSSQPLAGARPGAPFGTIFARAPAWLPVGQDSPSQDSTGPGAERRYSHLPEGLRGRAETMQRYSSRNYIRPGREVHKQLLASTKRQNGYNPTFLISSTPIHQRTG